jgi:hypothetical protein
LEEKELRTIERQILEAVDGICEKAEGRYLKRLRSDPEIQDAFNQIAVHDRLRVLTANIRAEILAGDQQPDRGVDAIEGASSRITRSLLDLPLHGGLKLGDAKWEELDWEIDIREAMARGNAIQAKFLTLVRKAVPDATKQVRDVLTEKRVRAMYTRAKK